MATTVTSKGQVTIPKHIRDFLGLKPGSQVDFDVNPQGRIEVLPSRPCQVETVQERLERALAALEVDNRWNGTTDEYMALIRGED